MYLFKPFYSTQKVVISLAEDRGICLAFYHVINHENGLAEYSYIANRITKDDRIKIVVMFIHVSLTNNP